MSQLKPIMFVGTGSDAGKSMINAGFCRIFKQDGYSPAPFKAQNMALNSFATPDGLEIGRAQAVQAEACQIPCLVEMNPVLLKPTGEMTSQVVLMGKPVGNQSAYDYFTGNNRQALFDEAFSAFKKLKANYNPIVMEGAGSISELNLKDRDITNMRIALAADADVYLVADIDRGGVFGSVYGTIMLLSDEERDAIKGIIINKFRGDIRLFEEGRAKLEEITGKHVVGVVPWFHDIFIEEEDSVSLSSKNASSVSGKINIAVLRLGQLSNFTDFNALALHPDVNLYYTLDKGELQRADIILLPGSKNTIADMQLLVEKGLDRVIKSAYEKGKKVVGVCGGYQMMGQEITDPYGIESEQFEIKGLGLLPVTTVLTQEKVTEQCLFKFRNSKVESFGYEIHMGETVAIHSEVQSVNVLTSGKSDGCWLNSRCWGTYLHGIWDNAVAVDELLSGFDVSASTFDYHAFKEENYNKLAAELRNCMDLEFIYSNLLKRN